MCPLCSHAASSLPLPPSPVEARTLILEVHHLQVSAAVHHHLDAALHHLLVSGTIEISILTARDLSRDRDPPDVIEVARFLCRAVHRREDVVGIGMDREGMVAGGEGVQVTVAIVVMTTEAGAGAEVGAAGEADEVGVRGRAYSLMHT